MARSTRLPHPAGPLRPTRWLCAAALAAGLSACNGTPSPPPIPAAPGDPLSGEFSADRAWADLESLAGLGPRPLGSEGAAGARLLIRERLEAVGIPVETLETTLEAPTLGELTLTHLAATLPGHSSDRIVLVAPYDSGLYDDFSFVGTNDGASGAALLIELARVLARAELAYTIEFVWLEGEGRLGRGDPETREQRWLGSRSLALDWAEAGELDDIRLLVSFNRVCDAELEIARDLGSHRSHREEFWKAAQRLGRSASFPRDGGYESITSSNVAFRRVGVRRSVAIADSSFGGDEAPGLFAATENDLPANCARDSLDTVGRVTLEALDTIATRLAKIDRFSMRPTLSEAETQAVESEAAVPETEPQPASEPESAPAEEPGA